MIEEKIVHSFWRCPKKLTDSYFTVSCNFWKMSRFWGLKKVNGFNITFFIPQISQMFRVHNFLIFWEENLKSYIFYLYVVRYSSSTYLFKNVLFSLFICVTTFIDVVSKNVWSKKIVKKCLLTLYFRAGPASYLFRRVIALFFRRFSRVMAVSRHASFFQMSEKKNFPRQKYFAVKIFVRCGGSLNILL